MEVLKFCCRGQFKFLHFVSTIAATYATQPDDRKGSVIMTLLTRYVAACLWFMVFPPSLHFALSLSFCLVFLACLTQRSAANWICYFKVGV